MAPYSAFFPAEVDGSEAGFYKLARDLRFRPPMSCIGLLLARLDA